MVKILRFPGTILSRVRASTLSRDTHALSRLLDGTKTFVLVAVVVETILEPLLQLDFNSRGGTKSRVINKPSSILSVNIFKEFECVYTELTNSLYLYNLFNLLLIFLITKHVWSMGKKFLCPFFTIISFYMMSPVYGDTATRI